MGRLLELGGRPVRWIREHPFAADWLLAGALVVISLIIHAVTEQQPPNGRFVRDPNVWTVLLVVATAASIATRRRSPVLTLVVATSLQVVCEMASVQGSGWIGVLVAIYSVAAHAPPRPRRISAAVAGVGIAVVVVAGVLVDDVPIPEAISAMALFVASFVVGDNMRRRREHVQSLAERADRAERERDLLARERVAEERNRIARELHDIVAHSVSVMVLQAGAARRQMDRSPEASIGLLHNIEDTGRRTMDELRQVLGVLRDADGPLAAPLPTLADLSDLVGAQTEVRVSLEVTGDTTAVPDSLGLTTYRVVQEALTNSRRHGGPGVAVSVRVACSRDGVDVMVDDDGRGASSRRNGNADGADGGGYGLVGMRERATAAGGTLTVGPRSGGGWRVRARLPITVPASASAAS